MDLRKTVFGLILLLAVLGPQVRGADPFGVRAPNGIVVSPSIHASEAGAQVLRDGGNAADATVATALVLAVTYPLAGNLAGGGFILYRSPDGEHHALDCREVAPAALTAEMFLDEEGRAKPLLSRRGGLAVGVPGSVAGLAELHRKHGKLPWKRLVQPAIEIARKGFPLTRRDAHHLASQNKVLNRHPESGAIFTDDGAPHPAGFRLVQKDLAATLRLLARKGPEGFYRGPVAEGIVQTVRDTGGVMTLQDLADYKPVWREPLVGSYRGYRVVTFPPPSSGGIALLQMLGMLEAHDLAKSGAGASRTIHRMTEIERRVYADRSRWLGDPDFYDVPTAELLDPAYLRLRAADISMDEATPSEKVAPGEPRAVESRQTLHFSVADRDGGAIAMTTTLNGPLGTGMVGEGTGVLLNNEIDDFALAQGVANTWGLLGGEANAVKGNKRPLSSMTPTLLEQQEGGDWKLRMVLGSPGGGKIITSVLQVLLNYVDHDMHAQAAVNAPRFHHQWHPDELMLEPTGFVHDVIQALEKRGHRVTVQRGMFGNVNAIEAAEDGGWIGAPDPRRESRAAGH
ncbi:hypothetical protein ABI59_02255 [Acidobacteria bacterium Mor1]|nr:hypothetical protein ABI59_02255 [Acidobacteria bacterium Mor1]